MCVLVAKLLFMTCLKVVAPTQNGATTFKYKNIFVSIESSKAFSVDASSCFFMKFKEIIHIQETFLSRMVLRKILNQSKLK